jgi:hypothetical protein
MGRVCRNCSRVNPPEAFYCYYDGAVLDGHGLNGGPIAVGAQPFLTPFVFPSGRRCRNFDELVLACDTEWQIAQNLLQNDFFEGFFRGMGRADLAIAARQYARSGDHDRALDEFLSKLPCTRRDSAKLFAQPLEVNLGQVARGRDHRFILHLENQGAGLLYGTVLCTDTNWLSIGDGSAASPQKIFQCRLDATLPINIVAKNLRAGNKPLEGRLTIESNGGQATILVRLEVPPVPFPDGVLVGALTPRQVAERAKASPKEAAPLFEHGAVGRWYESNGWIYPVQGPSASGLGAVQQFFEALGLTTPPHVEISEQHIQLRGAPGASLEYTLHLQAVEKRPVFAHATTSTPWVQIAKIHLGGQKAKITVRIPSVPALPGEQLQAKVHVTANGNQRFVVALSLTVDGKASGRSFPAALPVLDMADVMAASPVLALPASAPLELHSGARLIPPVRNPHSADPSHVSNHLPLLQAVEIVEEPLLEVVEPVRPLKPFTPFQPVPAPAVLPTAVEPTGAGCLGTFVAALLPLAVLSCALLGTLVHDLLFVKSENAVNLPLLDPNPRIAVQFHDGLKPGDVDRLMPEPSMRFGIQMTTERDPKDAGRFKRLTFDDWGRTNNTVIRIDGNDTLFGYAPCAWMDRKGPLGKDPNGRERSGLRSKLVVTPHKVEVTQTVEIIPGEQSHALDTCLISYMIQNKDNNPHSVGLRFMLDTFIGAEDGVPFTIPGDTHLCDTNQLFTAPAVPQYIEALEYADLKNPGTVARLQFHLGNFYESPTRVQLCGWPKKELQQKPFFFTEAREEQTMWSVPFVSMQALHNSDLKMRDKSTPPKDSCVVVYWDPRPLRPGEAREVGFTYGLGNVASGESGGKLLLSLGGRLVRDGDLTLTALVSNPERGERLVLEVPPELRSDSGADQEVPLPTLGAARQNSPVTWKIHALKEGTFTLTVRSTKGAAQSLKVTIRSKGVFD